MKYITAHHSTQGSAFWGQKAYVLI